MTMKTKLFLATLALPLAFGACTNDDFETASQIQGTDGQLVNVGPGFVISAGNADNAATKGEWVAGNGKLNFMWWPKIGGTTGAYTVTPDEIGIAWIGQSVGTNVYTNYRFQHAGWLEKDEMAAEVDPCNNKVSNGLNINWGNTTSDDGTGLKINGGATATTLPNDGTTIAEINSVDYDLNTAFFTTPTETMFGGDYIAYSPFNKDMKDQGPIMATTQEKISVELASPFAHLGSAMFEYGYAPELVGGTQASRFAFKHLSGLVRVRLSGVGLTNVTSVALVDSEGKLVKSVGLDASKIVAEGNSAVSTGSALYVPGTAEYTKMLTADVTGSWNTAANSTNDVYFAALPTTTGALQVVLYNGTSGKSAVYNAAAITVVPGGVQTVTVSNVVATDFNKNVVITEAALKELVCSTQNSGNNNVDANTTVTLLGDIELNSDWTMDVAATLEGGKIIVPHDVNWTVEAAATIKSDIDIEGQDCCDGTKAGQMMSKGATLAGEVNVLPGNGKGKAAGILNFGGTSGTNKVAATSTINNNGSITFYANTNIEGTLNVEEGATANVGKGSNAPNVNVNGGIVNNKGTFEVVLGNFAVGAAPGQATTNADGKKFKNNGTFIDNVGAVVGGIVANYMDMGTDAKYICKVNSQARLEEAYNNKQACNVVEFIEGIANSGSDKATNPYIGYDISVAKQHANKDLDVIVSGQNVEFEPVKEAKIGNLKVAGTLTVNATKDITNAQGTVVGTATIAVKGNIEVDANGKFTTASDVIGMTAENLTVYANGSAKFEKRTTRTGVTMDVAHKILVEKDGSLEIEGGAQGDVNAASVICESYQGTMNGYPTIR